MKAKEAEELRKMHEEKIRLAKERTDEVLAEKRRVKFSLQIVTCRNMRKSNLKQKKEGKCLN